MLQAIFHAINPASKGSEPVTAAVARKLIHAGRAPDNLHVQGMLDLSNSSALVSLPLGLRVDSLDLSNCGALKSLPANLRLRCLKLNIDLTNSAKLEALPMGLSVGSLLLRDCRNLESLPEDLNVFFLDISGCAALRDWPQRGSIRFGHLRAQGCAELRSLSAWIGNVSQLDLRDCTSIQSLPEGLMVNTWLDLANTGITSLPPEFKDMPLRWRGVPVDARIACLLYTSPSPRDS